MLDTVPPSLHHSVNTRRVLARISLRSAFSKNPPITDYPKRSFSEQTRCSHHSLGASPTQTDFCTKSQIRGFNRGCIIWRHPPPHRSSITQHPTMPPWNRHAARVPLPPRHCNYSGNRIHTQLVQATTIQPPALSTPCHFGSTPTP